jgi:hypothetical protein
VTDPAEFRRPHPMLSGAHGGQTLSYQQLARDGVRLLGRLAAVEGHAFTFGPDLARNMESADQAAEQFRRSVDEYVARAGIAAPPPDTDPAERPGPASGTARERWTPGPSASPPSCGAPDSGRTPAGCGCRYGGRTAASSTPAASLRSPACT